MTPASTDRNMPWFAQAGAACSIVPIARFVGPNIFALKRGGYGCLFSVTGIDEEGRTDEELEARVRSLEGALRGLPLGACLYQYTRLLSGYDIPRQPKYDNSVTEDFVNDRLTFLAQNASFRRISLHWCLTLEPPITNIFAKTPTENVNESARRLAELQKTANLLETHLKSSIGLKLLGKQEAFQFFSYLFNLEEWTERAQLRTDDGVDRQIVRSPVSWHNDHLRVGKRYVQLFSLTNTPEASRPCVFSSMFTLDCDSILCTTWRPQTNTEARKEVTAQEKFTEFFKHNIFQRLLNKNNPAELERTAGAKAATEKVDELSEVVKSLDRKVQGKFTLKLLLAGKSQQQLNENVPMAHRLFVDANAPANNSTYTRCGCGKTIMRGCRLSLRRI